MLDTEQPDARSADLARLGRSLVRYGTVGLVRMYLSSFRLGHCPKRLVSLARNGEAVAVIANAMDAAPPDVREAGVQREVLALTGLGFTVDELDLRSYFLDASPLSADLRRYDVVWLRGGNASMLRYALGTAHVIVDRSRSREAAHREPAPTDGPSAGRRLASPLRVRRGRCRTANQTPRAIFLD
jgi:hypothetical protein